MFAGGIKLSPLLDGFMASEGRLLPGVFAVLDIQLKLRLP